MRARWLNLVVLWVYGVFFGPRVVERYIFVDHDKGRSNEGEERRYI